MGVQGVRVVGMEKDRRELVRREKKAERDKLVGKGDVSDDVLLYVIGEFRKGTSADEVRKGLGLKGPKDARWLEILAHVKPRVLGSDYMLKYCAKNDKAVEQLEESIKKIDDKIELKGEDISAKDMAFLIKSKVEAIKALKEIVQGVLKTGMEIGEVETQKSGTGGGKTVVVINNIPRPGQKEEVIINGKEVFDDLEEDN